MSAGSTTMSARVSSPSSRSSGVVNAACAGPRRPSTITSCTEADAERRDGVIGGVGDRDLVGVEHEHAGDVDGDVAVADHDRARGAEVELVVGVVRVAVVPGHELQGAVRAGAVLTGDAEPVVGRGADRVEHDVVAIQQVLAADVAAELDAAVEAEARVLARSSRRRA